LDKYPQDILLYADAIFKRKPDYIIETGTFYGGSALFFGDMLLLTGGKKVFSIDNRTNRNFPAHPLVEYVNGSSSDPNLINELKRRLDGTVMVSLDSDHSTHHVRKELELFAPIVSRGQYIVVEDCYHRGKRQLGPFFAVKDFLETHKEFKQYDIAKRFVFGITKGGWLRKI